MNETNVHDVFFFSKRLKRPFKQNTDSPHQKEAKNARKQPIFMDNIIYTIYNIYVMFIRWRGANYG